MSDMKKNQSSTEEKALGSTDQGSAKNKPVDKKISDLVGPIFESLGVEEGIVIAKFPGTDKISVYFKGHFYDAAALVAGIHRQFKQKIAEEIGG